MCRAQWPLGFGETCLRRIESTVMSFQRGCFDGEMWVGEGGGCGWWMIRVDGINKAILFINVDSQEYDMRKIPAMTEMDLSDVFE